MVSMATDKVTNYGRASNLWWSLVGFCWIQLTQGNILEITPLFGPHAGGTLIAISVNDSNFQLQKYQVYIGHQPCSYMLDVVNQSVILCQTMPSWNTPSEEIITTVTVISDKNVENYKIPFIYKRNPSIENVYPAVAFLGGGIQQTVTGRNFDSVAYPAMHVIYKNNFLVKDLYDILKYPACDVRNSTLMLCTVPRTLKEDLIPKSLREDFAESKFLNDDVNDWFMTFYMDGIVSGQSEEYKLQIAENPVINKWNPETVIYEEGVAIVIKGGKLNYGAKTKDVNVTIGTNICPIIQLTPNSIRCQPPDLSVLGNNKLKVKVTIGQELEFEVGYLKYGEDLWENETNRTIVYCAIGMFLLLMAGVIIFISYRWRQTKNKMKVKVSNP